MVEMAFRVDETAPSRQPTARELAQRLRDRFPTTVVDWRRGDAYVQAGLDRLASLGTPEVILRSHSAYFGNVVFVSVSEPHWAGVVATSYVHGIRSPLDDAVLFDVQGPDDPERTAAVFRELGDALGLSLCAEADAEPGA
ncbi:MAG: hypothetical protein ACRC1K_14340 [Planctomycetia bacterium]